jgi:hypothetical protein
MNYEDQHFEPIAEIEIDKAIFAYADAYHNLAAIIQKYPSEFPRSAISCGTIAEHYAKKYLEKIHPDTVIRFGAGNEKGWDIEAKTKDGPIIKYQVKSSSVFSATRKTSALVKGFDRLIILFLDGRFFTTEVYLFNFASIFWHPKKTKSLTLPDSSSPRKVGSKIFQNSLKINDPFFESLE